MILRILVVTVVGAALIANGLQAYQTIQSQERDRAELIAESVARLLAGVDADDTAKIRDLAVREAERWGVSVVVAGGDDLRPIATHFPHGPASAHTTTGTAIVRNEVQAESPRTVQIIVHSSRLPLIARNTTLLALVLASAMMGLFILTEVHHRRGRLALDRLLQTIEEDDEGSAPYPNKDEPVHGPAGLRWPNPRTARRIEEVRCAIIQARQDNRIERERIRQREAAHEETERRLAVQAHDLRAPLANIHAYALAASRRAPGLDGRAGPDDCNIAGILEACNVMNLIVSDHLEERRANIGGTDAVEVVERAVLLHQQIADKKMVTILLRVDERVPRRMRVKETSLWHGVSNLLSNAIRFSPDGDVIHVWMGPSDNERHQWAIDIMDSGPGVPNGWEERIFEEGTQAEKGTAISLVDAENEDGVGLGLNAARAFARWEWGDANVMRGRHSGSGAWFRWEWKDRGLENDIPDRSHSTVWVSIPDAPDLERDIAAHVQRAAGALVVIGPESMNVGRIDLSLVSREVWTTNTPDEPYLVLSDHALHLSPINRTHLARWVTTREIREALKTNPPVPETLRKSVRTDGALLLVDDIDSNNEAVAALVHAVNGGSDKPEILMARGAAEAKSKLEQGENRIWGMIADYQMPDENGLELIAWVRHQHPEVRCAMITGDPRPEIHRQALVAGAEVVLGRPVDEGEMIRFLNHTVPPSGLKPLTGGQSAVPGAPPARFLEGLEHLIAKALHAARAHDRKRLLGVLHAAKGSCAMLQMEEWVLRFEKIESHLFQGCDLGKVTNMLEQLEQYHETARNHRH